MSKEKLYIFDTTLRDGAQTEGVDFSVEDKNKIAKVLSDIGVDYIEGGWPGANPVDTEFFSKPPDLNKSIFTAFGMTKKTGRSAANDPSLSSLINASCPAICVVGKAWDFHVKTALEIKNEDLPYEQRDHALFVAFAPYSEPQYSISVVVEHGGSGSKSAAPIAKKVIKKLLERHPLRQQIHDNYKGEDV